jgi:PEP-CTERM motif
MRPSMIATILAGFFTLGGGISTASAGVYSYGSYNFSGGNVHFSDASLGIDNYYGGAGLITLNGSPVMAAYCVDIGDWLSPSGSYNIGVNPATNPNLIGNSSITGDSKIADIGALIFNGGNAAAVQLAIWETEYGSAASFTPDDGSSQTLADTYLDDAKTIWSVPANFTLFELTPADGQVNQSLVYLFDAPAPVPEPGTFTLLGGGLLLTGLLVRRRPSADVGIAA